MHVAATLPIHADRDTTDAILSGIGAFLDVAERATVDFGEVVLRATPEQAERMLVAFRAYLLSPCHGHEAPPRASGAALRLLP